VPSANCDPARRNTTMAIVNPDVEQDIVNVAPLREMGTYLVTDSYPEVPGHGRVWECSLNETDVVMTDCLEFAVRPENSNWDPYALLLDEDRKVVYVSDYNYHKIHMFRYDGEYLGRLEDESGALVNPSSMAIGPGMYTPNCLVTPQTTATAGSTIELPLALRDQLNQDFNSEYQISRLQVLGSGTLPGTEFEFTIPGNVTHDPYMASLAIEYAGVWTVSVTGGLANSQNFAGSPLEVTVSDVASSVIVAGSPLTLRVFPHDVFKNPTVHADDAFYCTIDESLEQLPFARANADFSLSHLLTTVGGFKLHLFHENTGKEIDRSPFSTCGATCYRWRDRN